MELRHIVSAQIMTLLLGGVALLESSFLRETSVSKQATIEIGHHLFFDRNLSLNRTKSCASCHDPKLAYTDGYRRSLGATADVHKRNAPTLLNSSDNAFFTAADPRLTTLEKQIALPLFNQNALELGILGHEDEVLERLKNNTTYQHLFSLFNLPPTSLDITLVISSLASYCKQLHSYNSRYDKFVRHDSAAAFTKREIDGMNLFFSQRLACSKCHGGKNFNTPLSENDIYTRNGFYSSKEDTGLYEATNNASDRGRFRIPTLRNIELTAPYMHDGSVSSLEEVIRGYSHGGNNKENISTHIKPLLLSNDEKKALILFLMTLSDTSYLNNRLFVSPWKDDLP